MRTLSKISLLLSAMMLTNPAMAGTKIGDFELNPNMSLVTDYVWRSISQSDQHPAVQGGITVNHTTGLYAGVWASSVDFNDNDQASMELDLFGGFTYQFPFGMKVDAGIIRYLYPGADSILDYDFNEFYLGLSYKIREFGMSAKYSYSDDFFGASDSAHYAEAGLSYDLPEGFVIAAHYGHSDFDLPGKPDNYNDYSIGVSKEILGFGVDLSYYATDKNGRTMGGDLADDRVILKLNKNF